MKYRAGLRFVAFVWMGVLMQGLDAGCAPKKHSAVQCRLKSKTTATIILVEKSLELFVKVNGEPTGTWDGGFPLLQEKKDSRAEGSKVQCSLLFMAQGLKKVLEDQKVKTSVELQKKLNKTIYQVKVLAKCSKQEFQGECTQKPAEPKMPKYAPEKKQWSHTLLVSAKAYLDWLESKAQTTPSTLPLRDGVNSV